MKKILTLLIITVLTLSASASYRKVCNIQYQKQYGWSDYYTVEVNFSSGMELNKATNSWNFNSYSTYAVIFWSREQVTVIELDSYTGCGTTVSSSCIERQKYLGLDGKDKQGVKWEICLKNYC